MDCNLNLWKRFQNVIIQEAVIYIETGFDEIIYLPIRSSHCQYIAANLLTLHKCHEETSNNGYQQFNKMTNKHEEQ
jgi:hypothetical protein